MKENLKNGIIQEKLEIFISLRNWIRVIFVIFLFSEIEKIIVYIFQITYIDID
jgi:hypothetical protein